MFLEGWLNDSPQARNTLQAILVSSSFEENANEKRMPKEAASVYDASKKPWHGHPTM